MLKSGCTVIENLKSKQPPGTRYIEFDNFMALLAYIAKLCMIFDEKLRMFVSHQKETEFRFRV